MTSTLSASAEAVCVDPKQVTCVWECVKHWIKRAMERGDLGTFDAVEDDVITGQALLWLVWSDPEIQGAAVTQIVTTQNSKVCMITACGGENMRLWLPLIEKIEGYARDEGCDAVRILGRKGWMRVLKDYRAPAVILERRL
jgi:hypothetical protein